MPTTVLAGLAVDSNSNSQLNTGVFSSVSVTPAAWSDTDIGSPGLAGSATYYGGTWTVQGSGGDIWNASDQFNFINQPLIGDSVLAHLRPRRSAPAQRADALASQRGDPVARAAVAACHARMERSCGEFRQRRCKSIGTVV